LFLLVNFNNRIFLEDDIFESTRSTQISVIQDSLNLGELFVDHNYSIHTQEAMSNWIKQFDENRNNKLHYVIDFVGIHETPPAIAVRVRGYSSLNLSDESLELDYTNLVLIEERGHQ
ncbi:MAG: DUF5411 family protein, partial [Longicatena sp.]